ncbi:hypothetical protein [Arthrobacter koreensis]|uniref:hypothetical protein n=1 Tax=Arthrobacter koreensis TaxID=199136 RepID=UPI0038046C06
MDLRTRRGQVVTFAVLPMAAGLVVLITGALFPVSFMIGLLVVLSVAAQRGHGGPGVVVPRGDPHRRSAVARWWNRRRRTGFYAALSVLLMLGFALARSAFTDTWGGGDILFAVGMALPLFVILRPPPWTRTQV